MEPFLPFSMAKLRGMLQLEGEVTWERIGASDLLATGHQLEQPVLLFEKMEDDVIQAQLDRLEAIKKLNAEAALKAAKPMPIGKEIAFEDFEKLDLRVATVKACAKVPKTDKLLHFTLDDGFGERTIISGLAKHYEPETLVGKQVIFVANLAPRKMRGIESQGMILSVEEGDGSLSVLTTSKQVKPGSKVS